MIGRDEIESASAELGINTSDVQRDYVFGWLIGGLYNTSRLRDTLALKGGNALRKAYFPATRFSDDLDFTTSGGLDGARLIEELNGVCRYVGDRTGIVFDLDRNRLADEHYIDAERKVYKIRLYFRDFYGNPETITLKVRVDITEFDRIYLPVQTRRLIHPYSDAETCAAEIRVIKLEEALADKLKCLLQRRYAHDLFDLVYGVFVNHELAVDRGELVRTFLKKTIFEPSPVAARDLLFGVPFELMRGFWGTIICPRVSSLSFESAVGMLKNGLAGLFASFAYGAGYAAAYYPAELRNKIMQAATSRTLLQMRYHGVRRLIEPYALAFKLRVSDGVAQEYFYGWDQTGGNTSGPGIKAFFWRPIEQLDNTETPFTPKFEIELAKAGNRASEDYFARPFASGPRGPRTYAGAAYGGHTVECSYCGRRFRRTTSSTRLNPHKDGYGNDCYGRVGYQVY
jgi:predicted nucleotidyltransferase component of viral defense system